MPRVNVDGRTMDYTEYSLHTGPVPLILLAEADEWWKPVAKLMPWDYFIAELAWTGDPDQVARDTLDFARAMRMPWLHIAGYGAGSRAALLAAAAAPDRVRSLSLIAPAEGVVSEERALPWQQVAGLATPTLILEPEGASDVIKAVDDRLLESLPNSQPELILDWRLPMSSDLAHRLGAAIVTHIVSAYLGTSPAGVTILRTDAKSAR